MDEEIKNTKISNSPLIVSKKSFEYLILTLVLSLIGYFLIGYYGSKSSSYDTVKICTFISVGFMVIQYINFAKYSGSFISNYAIFLIIFIIFNFGLFFVFSIGGEYNYFYLKQYEVDTILKTIHYEFGCVGSLFIAGTWINKIEPFKFKGINNLSRYTIYKTAKLFMYITGIVAFALLSMKVIIFARGYYEGVRSFDASVPSILGLIEYFFVPFSVLTLLYSKNKKVDKFINIFVIVWSLITAMCGDRTSGIAGILIIMIINFRFKGKNKKSLKKYFLFGLTIIIVLYLIVFIKAFREGLEFSATGILSIIYDVLGEMGSSFLPLTLIMRICPRTHSYLFGSSYIYSILSGFIPASLDPTGTISLWNAKAIEPLNWIATDYDYTFGTGYSLCAEAYANFGYFGFIILFFIGLIIIKLLANKNDNEFSKYTSTILMFEFFSLARRNFYYIINHPFYCIVLVSLVIYVMNKKFIRKVSG